MSHLRLVHDAGRAERPRVRRANDACIRIAHENDDGVIPVPRARPDVAIPVAEPPAGLTPEAPSRRRRVGVLACVGLLVATGYILVTAGSRCWCARCAGRRHYDKTHN